jgi:murein DD-endopeptidase MepM/ murein hydrolase activator NlpD
VELVRASDGSLVRAWPATTVVPGTPQTVVWDGTVDGEVADEGRYEFRIVTGDAATTLAASATEEPAAGDAAAGSFLFLRHAFPIRGRHDYGEFAATFGGGRGHQGQDVFAECGTPVVAARAGQVQLNGYHGAAGNYVVIDGDGTGVDYVYMHLREAAVVEEGERVRTGEPIGRVGATGRATGCHLHFEMWTAPGWYSGGAPVDPLPELRQWDSRS